MTIKIYVNFAEEEVLSEKEAKAYVENQANSYRHDDKMFNEWLSGNYCAIDLFMSKEEEKKNIIKDYEEFCHEEAKNLFDTRYEAFEVHV